MVAASLVAARDKRTAPFEPFTLLPAGGLPVCLSAAIATPVLSHRAAFGRATFLRAMSELVLHPERTSAHVLRSEILDERSLLDDPRARLGPTEAGAAVDEHPTVVRFVRRRLLPNQPSLERPLEQEVTFGRSDTGVWVEMRSLVGRSADVSCGLPAVRVLRCAYLLGPRRESLLELIITPFVDTIVDHDSVLLGSCLDHLRTIVETATKQTSQDDCRLPEVRARFSSLRTSADTLTDQDLRCAATRSRSRSRSSLVCHASSRPSMGTLLGAALGPRSPAGQGQSS
jgi:hypothetical protein